MENWRKLIGFVGYFFCISCIPTATCEDGLEDNKSLEIQNFQIKRCVSATNNELILENDKGKRIKFRETLAILIYEKSRINDIINKKSNENSIDVNRNDMDLRFTLMCQSDISVLKVYTLVLKYVNSQKENIFSFSGSLLI